MCGRYRLNSREFAIALATGEVKFVEFSELKIPFATGEYRPSNYLPIVRDEHGQPIGDAATWGFVPSWARGEKMPKPINAKSETVASSGMFREAFKISRCLLPATGFFEPKGPKTLKHREQFYFYQPDHKVFAMAGIVSNGTVALITTTPNKTMAPIHDRMPVILQPTDYAKWLNPETELADVRRMMRPAPDEALIYEAEKIPAVKEPTLFD